MGSYQFQEDPFSSSVRIGQRFAVDPDEDDLIFSAELQPSLVLPSRNPTSRTEKKVWHIIEESNGANSSGRFRRLLHSTATRKPEKYPCQAQSHKVELNLHQFQTESGDTLGEDTESWARLTF